MVKIKRHIEFESWGVWISGLVNLHLINFWTSMNLYLITLEEWLILANLEKNICFIGLSFYQIWEWILNREKKWIGLSSCNFMLYYSFS